MGRVIEFRVRYTCGAYVTQTVQGQRASSTSSNRRAAEMLARKAFGKAPASLEPVGAPDDHLRDRWRAQE